MLAAAEDVVDDVVLDVQSLEFGLSGQRKSTSTIEKLAYQVVREKVRCKVHVGQPCSQQCEGECKLTSGGEGMVGSAIFLYELEDTVSYGDGTTLYRTCERPSALVSSSSSPLRLNIRQIIAIRVGLK